MSPKCGEYEYASQLRLGGFRYFSLVQHMRLDIQTHMSLSALTEGSDRHLEGPGLNTVGSTAWWPKPHGTAHTVGHRQACLSFPNVFQSRATGEEVAELALESTA